MELSENTLNILKNYSGINPNMMIRSGNTIKTISEARTVLSTAVVDTNFPKDFGIYDLNEFMGVLSLVDTPRLNFEDEYVVVNDSTGRSKVKYFYSSEDTLTTPQKDITMPEGNVKFKLDNETMNRLKKAASTLGHSEISITGDNGVLSLSVVDSQNKTSNAFSIDIDGEFDNDAKFNFVLSTNNLKILPGDYDVIISSKLISQFNHTSLDIKYWIALEKTSTFGA